MFSGFPWIVELELYGFLFPTQTTDRKLKYPLLGVHLCVLHLRQKKAQMNGVCLECSEWILHSTHLLWKATTEKNLSQTLVGKEGAKRIKDSVRYLEL